MINKKLSRFTQWLAALMLGGLLANHAGAQNLFAINGGNSIAEYDPSGNLVNGSFVTGLTGAVGLTFDGGGNLYVSYNSGGSGGVAKYGPSGNLINSTFASGLSSAYGLTIDDSGNLYVADHDAQSISEYNSSGGLVNQTGASIDVWLFTEWVPTGSAGTPYGLAWSTSAQDLYYSLDVDGEIFRQDYSKMTDQYQSSFAALGVAVDSLGYVYTSSPGQGVVLKWDATLDSSVGFATGLNDPTGITVDSSNNVYVSTTDGINEYDSNGVLINTINDSNSPGFMAIQPVPEPSVFALASLGLVALFCRRNQSS